MKTLRTETRNGVGTITLARAAEYNTITPELRDELAAAIDRADADHGVHVILLRADKCEVENALRDVKSLPL